MPGQFTFGFNGDAEVDTSYPLSSQERQGVLSGLASVEETDSDAWSNAIALAGGVDQLKAQAITAYTQAVTEDGSVDPEEFGQWFAQDATARMDTLLDQVEEAIDKEVTAEEEHQSTDAYWADLQYMMFESWTPDYVEVGNYDVDDALEASGVKKEDLAEYIMDTLKSGDPEKVIQTTFVSGMGSGTFPLVLWSVASQGSIEVSLSDGLSKTLARLSQDNLSYLARLTGLANNSKPGQDQYLAYGDATGSAYYWVNVDYALSALNAMKNGGVRESVQAMKAKKLQEKLLEVRGDQIDFGFEVSSGSEDVITANFEEKEGTVDWELVNKEIADIEVRVVKFLRQACGGARDEGHSNTDALVGTVVVTAEEISEELKSIVDLSQNDWTEDSDGTWEVRVYNEGFARIPGIDDGHTYTADELGMGLTLFGLTREAVIALGQADRVTESVTEGVEDGSPSIVYAGDVRDMSTGVHSLVSFEGDDTGDRVEAYLEVVRDANRGDNEDAENELRAFWENNPDGTSMEVNFREFLGSPDRVATILGIPAEHIPFGHAYYVQGDTLYVVVNQTAVDAWAY